jgi:hypothetical protein
MEEMVISALAQARSGIHEVSTSGFKGGQVSGLA